MKEIKALIHPTKLSPVLEALHRIPDMPGVTVSTVEGYGRSQEPAKQNSVNGSCYTSVEMSKIETVVPNSLEKTVVDTIVNASKTGRVGDGKIFVYNVSNVIKIRTGEKGETAI